MYPRGLQRRAIPIACVATTLTLAYAGTYAEPSAAMGPPGVVVRSIPIESPHTLSPFFKSLDALQARSRSRVRVLHYGDSNIAANLWTDVVRSRFQQHYGDGGTGYFVPPPWGSRLPTTVRLRGGSSWHPRRYGYGPRFGPMDGLWGLGGLAVESKPNSAPLHLRIDPEDAGALTVDLLGGPRGGTVSIQVGEDLPVALDTHRTQPALIRHRVEIPTESPPVAIRARSYRPVRLLGLSLERSTPGLVYDTLGINGHRAMAMLSWDQPLWAAQLEQSPPDLVITSYGGNEVLDRGLSLTHYEVQLAESHEVLRRVAPQASCLVVSPIAMCGSSRNAAVTAIQARIAARFGCGFWRANEVSGGPESLCHWQRAGLVAKDGLHLTERGYRIIGEQFADALWLARGQTEVDAR